MTLESGDPTPLAAWQRNCPASPEVALAMERVPFSCTRIEEVDEDELVMGKGWRGGERGWGM